MLNMKKLVVCFGVLALVAFLAAPVPAAANEKVQDWQLVNPAGVLKVTPIKLAPRITALEGKTIGLKWNQKPNGNILLDRIAELLKEKYPTAKIIKFYDVEPTTVPQTANDAQAAQKAKIIAGYKPDIVIGSQCD
jgi:hypothetical protein